MQRKTDTSRIKKDGDFVERRKHPRRRMSPKNDLQVTFKFKGGSVVEISVVNISRAGLLGYTSSIEHFIGIEDPNIEKIEIVEPGKETIKCSGRIMRVQPVFHDHKCYCAVEFNEETDDFEEASDTETPKPVEPDTLTPSYKVIDDRPRRKKTTKTVKPVPQEALSDDDLLARISSMECYSNLKDIKKEEELRQKAFTLFEDITDNLTIEEQWTFYDLLEVMKKHEPDYPEDAKRIFLKICRMGLAGTKETRPRVIVKDINESPE
ncbi:PilZ domain-containing protein [candidate division KSB1 bacterium]|nr:PilZ domain-containing protein [candidate division KSB1 bacterium]